MKKNWMLLLVIPTLFLSACAYKDIDKRIFVQGIGIDYTENSEKPFKITLKLYIPAGSINEAEGIQYAYISWESESLASAIQYLKSNVDKKIDFGHTRVIVLGHTLLSININEFMDVFYRRGDIQLVSWVMIARPSAEEILKTEPSSEMLASTSLPNFFGNEGAESAYIVSTPLFDVRRRSMENGIHAILPVIESIENKQQLKVNESVVLTKSIDYLGLTSQETKIYNVLAENVNQFKFHVDESRDHFTMGIDDVNVKFKIKPEMNTIQLDVKIAGIIEESDFKLADDKLPHYSKLVEKKLKQRIIDLLTKLQENKLDPLGFGLRYKATRLATRDLWKEWQQLYPQLEFDVTVDAGIKSTGTIE